MAKSIKNKVICLVSLFIAILLILTSLIVPNTTLSANADTPKQKKIITVFSWEDYIDEGYELPEEEVSDALLDIYAGNEDLLTRSVLDIFEEEYNVIVDYCTFATCEEMYNELKKDPTAVDIICPSEYMIMKMRDEKLIQPFIAPQAYRENVSPYINGVFNKIVNVDPETKQPLDVANGETYSAGYMWGTMGLLYNEDKYTDEDFATWSNLFDAKFFNKLTIKDSIRDSYIIAIAIVYEQELLELKNKLKSGSITSEQYNQQVFEIFNRVDEDAVEKAEKALLDVKKNLYKFEVDAGKADLLTGKIDVNFAWSGDAVFTMSEAEKIDKNLAYVVPQVGSNVWFDGWVLTKDADVESSLKFLEFLSRPEIVVRNIEYVGYTSCMGTKTVFEYAKASYTEDGGQNKVDLKYFFDPECTTDEYVIYTNQTNKQLYAQYADEDTILRCAVMDNFGDDDLKILNAMWNRVKFITLSDLALIMILVVAIIIALVAILLKYRSKIFKKIGADKDRPRRKHCKVIKIEQL